MPGTPKERFILSVSEARLSYPVGVLPGSATRRRTMEGNTLPKALQSRGGVMAAAFALGWPWGP